MENLPICDPVWQQIMFAVLGQAFFTPPNNISEESLETARKGVVSCLSKLPDASL